MDCGRFDQQTGGCPSASGTFNDGGVDLSAGFDSGSSGGSGGGSAGAPITGPPGAATIPDPLIIVRDGVTINCTAGTPCDPNLVVSIRDLVNFRPITPTQRMEPDGWALSGLPANFLANSATHTRTGLLLGFPAEVRFRPGTYHWDYGNDQTLNTGSGGASWAALSLPEFSNTPTSHVFAAPGSFPVTLAVGFAAEYRFAGLPWRAVQGVLVVHANPLTVVVGDNRTVLVRQDCGVNAAGTGC